MDREEHKQLKHKIIKSIEDCKKIKLKRKSETLWFDDSRGIKVCIMTSKSYSSLDKLKYWFTLKYKAKEFLDFSKKAYVCLGLGNGHSSAYEIPYFDNKKHFLKCNTTKTGWHIRIDHELKWYFIKNKNQKSIPLSNFNKLF